LAFLPSQVFYSHHPTSFFYRRNAYFVIEKKGKQRFA
jgi:hypothetical protein